MESKGKSGMWDFINSRFFSAMLIAFVLPVALYVVALAGSDFVARSITSGVGEAVADIAKGEKKETLKEMFSGFTRQLIDGVKAPFAEMQKEQDKQNMEEVAVLDAISIKNVKVVPSDFGGGRLIGTIVNGSNKHIQQVHISVSAYDEAGNLIDVSSEWLSDIKIVKAGEMTNFGITPMMLRSSRGKEAVVPAKLEVKASSFTIMKKEDATPS